MQRRGITTDLISPQAIALRNAMDRHVIDEISYADDRVTCRCGWTGMASDESFRRHNRDARKAAGMRPR